MALTSWCGLYRHHIGFVYRPRNGLSTRYKSHPLLPIFYSNTESNHHPPFEIQHPNFAYIPRTLPLQSNQTPISSPPNLLPPPTHLRSKSTHLMGIHPTKLVPRNLVFPLLKLTPLAIMARHAMDTQPNRNVLN